LREISELVEIVVDNVSVNIIVARWGYQEKKEQEQSEVDGVEEEQDSGKNIFYSFNSFSRFLEEHEAQNKSFSDIAGVGNKFLCFFFFLFFFFSFFFFNFDFLFNLHTQKKKKDAGLKDLLCIVTGEKMIDNKSEINKKKDIVYSLSSKRYRELRKTHLLPNINSISKDDPEWIEWSKQKKTIWNKVKNEKNYIIYI